MIKKLMTVLLLVAGCCVTSNLRASFYKSEKEFRDDVSLYEENVKGIKSCFDHISPNLSVRLKTILLFKEINKKTANKSDFKVFMDNLVKVTNQQENIVDGLYNCMIHGDVLKPLFFNLFNKPLTQTWKSYYEDLFPEEKKDYHVFNVWKEIGASPYNLILFKFFSNQGVFN